jgi:hypothetical protein
MRNIFLAPRSGKKPSENFRKTIQNGYRKQNIESYLSAEDTQALEGHDTLYIWGNRPGGKGPWKKMSKEDYIFFYQGKKITWTGELLHKAHNKSLADALWGQYIEEDKKESYEYVYFLENLKKVEIDYSILKNFAGYKPNAVVYGFQSYKENGIKNIIEQYGSIEDFIDSYATEEPRGKEVEVDPDEWIEVMLSYKEEGTVFQSAMEGRRYCVASVDEAGCVVERLDAREPERVTTALYKKTRELLSSGGGRCEFKDVSGTVALKTTILQARPLGLSVDKKTVLDLSDEDKALEAFCDIVKNLKVDPAGGKEKLYKPGMVASVIDGIENGELLENRIGFDWIAPRFVEKMRVLGRIVGEKQAATAFYHLTGDLFWMLSYQNPSQRFEATPSPAKIRQRVNHASIKDTFWRLLENRAGRVAVEEALKERWWPDNYVGDVQVWWVNQGKTYKAERKGGFIWAPQKDSNERVPFHWQNVAKVKTGDVVFHYAKGFIRAVSVANANSYESAKPDDISRENWSDEGWRVDVAYHELTPTIRISAVASQIARLNLEYGPIGRGGGVNQGYLYQLDREAARVIASNMDLDEIPEGIKAPLAQLLADGMPPPVIISGAEILKHVHSWITSKGFVFSKADLANFYCCLRTKPFVILAGLSGTGKTRFVRLFAEAVGATEKNHRYQIIPVRPDWNDNSELMGYFDLNTQYQPGGLVPILIRAYSNPGKPHFLCLDEMNLARVEHYFSDFLSVLESRQYLEQDGRKLAVTDRVLNREQIQKMNTDVLDVEVKQALEGINNRFPDGLGLPENLYIIGTVNMDETTYPFSRKVLDRANTIEFTEINLISGLVISDGQSEISELNLHNDAFRPLYLTMLDLLVDDRELARSIAEKLHVLNDTLAKGGCHVGYRVRDEASFYMKYLKELGGEDLDLEDGFEMVVLQKVLPRIQGSSYQVKTVLDELLEKFLPESRDLSPDDDDYTQKIQTMIKQKGPLVRKLGNMLIQYREEGFTSFWAN